MNRERSFILLSGIFAVLLGAFILFQTENFARTIGIGAGILVALDGLRQLGAGRGNQIRGKTFWGGLFSLLFGILLVFLPMFFVEITWTLALYALAFQRLLAAGYRILVNFRYREEAYRYFPVSGIIGNSVFALFLLLAPQFIGLTILRLFGILILGFGVSFLSGYFRSA